MEVTWAELLDELKNIFASKNVKGVDFRVKKWPFLNHLIYGIFMKFLLFLGHKMIQKSPFKVFSGPNIHGGHPNVTLEGLKGGRDNIFVLFDCKGG